MKEYDILDKLFNYREEQFIEEFRYGSIKIKTKNKGNKKRRNYKINKQYYTE